MQSASKIRQESGMDSDFVTECQKTHFDNRRMKNIAKNIAVGRDFYTFLPQCELSTFSCHNTATVQYDTVQ